MVLHFVCAAGITLSPALGHRKFSPVWLRKHVEVHCGRGLENYPNQSPTLRLSEQRRINKENEQLIKEGEHKK